MSRIESALEKAALLRSGTLESVAVGIPLSAPPFIPPPAPDNIRVSNPFLVSANDPHTHVAEEYRKLKSVLVKATNREDFRNTLMVTSALGNEGKSITSLNLAISMAQEHDHTVLLVDADLRKPSLHTYLGMEPEFGLSECITDGVDIGKALIRTGVGKLSLLPAGKQVRNPVELFSSQKARKLFLELKHRYPDRYIIIDAPPVLPFSESRTLSTIVDGIVFVVKEGVASLPEITEAMGYLKGAGLLGIVYNEASVGHLGSRYSYY